MNTVLDCIRQIPPQLLAPAFFAASFGLRWAFGRCRRRIPKALAALSCCGAMIAASYFLGEFAGHKAPWLLLAGIWCAFVPHFLAALSAVLGMGFGLCLLPGRFIPDYELRIMLFAFPAAALAYAGMIPRRFRNPGMMKGLGAACHYIARGNCPQPDAFMLAGMAAAGVLFLISRQSGRWPLLRPLRAWCFVWAFAMLDVWLVLHAGAREAGIAAAAEVLCAAALLLAWIWKRRRMSMTGGTCAPPRGAAS